MKKKDATGSWGYGSHAGGGKAGRAGKKAGARVVGQVDDKIMSGDVPLLSSRLKGACVHFFYFQDLLLSGPNVDNRENPGKPRDDLITFVRQHGGTYHAAPSFPCTHVALPDVMKPLMKCGRVANAVLAGDVMSEAWLFESVDTGGLVFPPRPEHFRHLSPATLKELRAWGYWDLFAVPYATEPTVVGRAKGLAGAAGLSEPIRAAGRGACPSSALEPLSRSRPSSSSTSGGASSSSCRRRTAPAL